MKILIVDDNVKMRRLMKSILGSLATVVYECSDGCEALASYAAYHPDVVLMDIEMAQMDGLCAAKQITTAFPAARVIIVTHYDDQHHRNAALAAGACDFLGKENLLELKQLLPALRREPDGQPLLAPSPE